MFQFLRSKFGPAVVTIIIGFIAFVFVFFGFYSPGSSGFGGSGGSAAVVNGEPITLRDFSRGYEQRVQFYQSIMKGKADVAMLAKLGLKKQVLDDLVRQKAMLQEARKLGFIVADEEVALRIKQMPYFQKDGKFDKKTYEQVLTANSQSPGRFEEMMRDDMIMARFQEFMRERMKVSDDELRQEFTDNADKRQVDFVLIPPGPDAKKTADEALAKAKTGGLKGFLTSKKLTQRTSESFSASSSFVPGMGEAQELRTDAFKADSPLAQGPRLYENHGAYIVAWNLKTIRTKEGDFPKERENLESSVLARKERHFLEEWSKDVMARAKIVVNDDLLRDGDDDAPSAMAPTAGGPEEL